MNPLDKARKLAQEMIEKRDKASRDYDTEDFNGCLLIDGVTGSFGFEMHKCDRDFIAYSANTAKPLAEMVLRLIRALEIADKGLQCHETFHRLGGIDDCEPCKAKQEIQAVLEGK